MEKDNADSAPAEAVNVMGVDAYAPDKIARRVGEVGVVKAALPLDKLLMLAVVAGTFIGLGAAFYTLVMTGATPGYGATRMLGGVAFSLGLVLVLVAGAELFTGNALIVMAWIDRHVSTVALLRNWLWSFLGNGAGAALLAFVVYRSGVASGGLGDTVVAIAEGKMRLSLEQAFFRGVLCNILVCLAVWLCFAARGVSGKILAIIFPISAFVALGFEHSIANLYLLPLGLMLGAEGGLSGLVWNLVPVTAGNIVGGAGGVAGVYWVIYGR